MAAGGLLIALCDRDGAAVGSGLAARIAAEAAGMDARLLIVTAPGTLPERALAGLLRERRAAVAVVETPPGCGGVARWNLAAAAACAGARDVLLLPEGTVPRAGAIAELAAVAALDPMTGFVAPRTNDGDIANSPYHEVFRPRDLAAARAAHEAIEPLLPRFTFVPTLPLSGLLIRHAMLREFGLFDEGYGDGPHEQHDLIRRANRCGYRAVLANHAYASRRAPPPPPDEAGIRNGERLHGRWPEFHRGGVHYFGGAQYRAQALMGGLVPDARGRRRVLFDGSMLRPYHNGTFEHATRLLAAFARGAGDRYAAFVLADDDAFRFHGLDRVRGLGRHRAGSRPRPYAIAFRMGQPFIREDIVDLAGHAPLTGFLMLDTIALDCQHITEADLDTLWRTMTDTADLIGYNSEASRAQFRRRFALAPAVHDFVTRCSTAVADYAWGPEEEAVPAGGVLLVGNRYAHKHLVPTFEALRGRSPDTVVRILGIDDRGADEASAHALGDLPQAEATARYRAADAVLYPSHYEGFGLPIMHALAAGTPVVARDLPPAREIAARSPLAANIHLADDTGALVALAADPPAWDPRAAEPARPPETWRDAALAVADAFDRALAGFDHDRLVARQSRLVSIDTSFAAERRAGHAAALADEAARRAGAADARAADADRRADEAGEARVRAERERDAAIDRHHAASDAARRAGAAASLAARDGTLERYGVARDFACGDAAPIVAAAIAVAREAPRGPDRAGRADASVDAPPKEGARWRIRLDARGVAAGDPRLAALLIGWAPAVTPGGTLILLRPRDTPGAIAALHGAGFSPTRVGKRAIEAVRLIEWGAMLPGPEDDGLFVTIAFRRALGRDPDATEAARFAAALTERSREALLAEITASPERPAMIASAIAAARAGR